jgi:dihydroorotate dehydrogenase (fumarate)
MENLDSSFMGIRMTSPVIAGSCPLNINLEMVRQFVAAGVGAVVLPSILQEQLLCQSMMKSDPLLATEQSGHAPQQDRYNGGPEAYL